MCFNFLNGHFLSKRGSLKPLIKLLVLLTAPIVHGMSAGKVVIFATETEIDQPLLKLFQKSIKRTLTYKYHVPGTQIFC